MKYFKISVLLTIVMLLACSHRSEYRNLPKNYTASIRNIKKPKVALVLGGGGARGYAHLGVIEVLEKNKIPIDLIVGTSAGSIVGALYANNPNVASLKEKLSKLTKWDFIRPSINTTIYGISDGWKLREFLTRELKNTNISEFKIPFASVTTSLEDSKTFVIDSGPAVPAVHASSALPDLYTPVSIYGKHLIDGGATEPVPVATAKLYNPKLIIAVNISTNLEVVDDYSKVRMLQGYNAIGLSYRAFAIAYYELAKLQTSMADINISPDLNGIGMFNDHQKEQLYQKGKEVAEKMLPLIKAKLAAAN
jgi:NTE family protein